jgi:hypothetical protein
MNREIATMKPVEIFAHLDDKNTIAVLGESPSDHSRKCAHGRHLA